MTPFLIFLLILLMLAAFGLLMYWLLITTEGVYLGRRAVVWLYDVYATRYERLKGFEPMLESRFLARPLMAALEPNNAPLVLDVATGTGRLPRALMFQPGFQGVVIGVDLSRRMLHQGAGRVAEGMHLNRVYLMHAPAEKLPFPDNTFDLVTCLEALEFMVSPRAVVAELVRVTRPGGQLLLTNRRGREAKLMPGKAWTPEQALSIYREEFGLEEVRLQVWQSLYDYIWAKKPGQSIPTRARPLGEVWQCPRCGEIRMQPPAQQPQTPFESVEQNWICENCGQVIPVGRDGVIELISVRDGRAR